MENETRNVTFDTFEQEKFRNSWLFRLFESQFFNMSIAISYLFHSKSPPIQEYICMRLYKFPISEIEFYLPQIINMYLQIDELSTLIHNFLLYTCSINILFSLKTAWLLGSFARDTWLPSKLQERGSRLIKLIFSEQISNYISIFSIYNLKKHKQNDFILNITSLNFSDIHNLLNSYNSNYNSNVRCSQYDNDENISRHKRSQSADLKYGLAFDNACICKYKQDCLQANQPFCPCGALHLKHQTSFIYSLCSLSHKLIHYVDKEERFVQLYSGLTQICLNLPARVCIPLTFSQVGTHQVLRIPACEAVLLNSKTKAPFLIFLEIVECESTFYSVLPSRKRFSFRENKSDISIKSQINSDTGDETFLFKNESVFHGNLSRNPSFHNFKKISQTLSPKSSNEIFFEAFNIRERLEYNVINANSNLISENIDRSTISMMESWEVKEQRIRRTSPYSHLPNWRLVGLIVKTGDDFRQELLAVQLLQQFFEIWQHETVPIWIRSYSVVVVSESAGLIEPIQNALSLHQIKSQDFHSLLSYFISKHGLVSSSAFKLVQKNFVQSCAGYCLFSYFTQLKDRHNGNILLDNDGHLIHIDYGFMLSNSPGSNLGFERSPFKLNKEFVDVMGGVKSDSYLYFKELMLLGFLAARKHMERLVQLVEILHTGSQLACFSGGSTVQSMRDRFNVGQTDDQITDFIQRMVDGSITSWTTKLYDSYQYYTSGIL